MSGSDAIILFGGASNERRGSLASPQHVAAVLGEAGAWVLAPSGAGHRVASGAGVRIARSVHLSKDPKVLRNELGEMLAIYRRIVVKPVAGGSSVGLYHVASAEEAERAARGIDESGEACLAEEFVSGTELTVGIVDGPSGPHALPASEVRLEEGRAFDYEGKYLGKGT